MNNTACQLPFDCGFPAARTESLLLLAEVWGVREELHLKVVVLKFRLTVEPVASLSAVFWMSRNALRDIQKTAARETIEPAAKAQKIFAIQPTRRKSTILKLSAEYSLKLKKKLKYSFYRKTQMRHWLCTQISLYRWASKYIAVLP